MTVRLVLVGLPGVGKTTVARALAAALDVPFVDVDDVVRETVGRSVADVLRDDGEAAFRQAELAALRLVLDARPSAVVATGGGIVELPAARDALRAAPLVVHLTAPHEVLVARLADGDRPLVDGEGASARLLELATRRAPWYAEVADVTLDASGQLDDVVDSLRILVVAA